MACQSCKAMGWNHEKVVKSCKDGLFTTGRFLCQFDKLSPKFHGPLCNWYQEAKKKGQHRFLIMTPRGHLKTSLFGVAESIHRIINDPESRTLFVHASADLAQKTLGIVQAVVLSDRFRHFFPELVPDPHFVPWNKQELTVLRKGNYGEATITARGIGSTLVGGHFTCIKVDDGVGPEAADSPAEMESAIRFIDRMAPLFVKPQDNDGLIIGTWWPGGYYEKLFAKSSYKKVVLGCYVDKRYHNFMDSIGYPHPEPNGSSLWPEEFSLEALQTIKTEDMTPFEFSHQYENLPVEEDMIPFRSDDFRYFAWQGDFIPGEGSKDPAGGIVIGDPN